MDQSQYKALRRWYSRYRTEPLTPHDIWVKITCISPTLTQAEKQRIYKSLTSYAYKP